MTRPSVTLLRSRTWPVVSDVDDDGQVIHYSYAELPGVVNDAVQKCPAEPLSPPEPQQQPDADGTTHAVRPDARPDLLDSCCVQRDEAHKKLFADAKPSGGTGKCEHQVPALVVCDPRKTATLYRHYYPEGGWGYVIVTCSVLVSVLGQGLQLSFGHLLGPLALKFGVHNTGDIGEYPHTHVLFFSLRDRKINCF